VIHEPRRIDTSRAYSFNDVGSVIDRRTANRVRCGGRGQAEGDDRTRERCGQAGRRTDDAGRKNSRMQSNRLLDAYELAATAVPTSSRLSGRRIRSECVGTDGGVRRRRQPSPSSERDPLRRSGGDGDDDKEIREARDATHDTGSIAPRGATGVVSAMTGVLGF
jgi:hypothetical protein